MLPEVDRKLRILIIVSCFCYFVNFLAFYDKDKDRLVNMMAYGQDIEPPKVVPKPEPVQYKDVDRFDERKLLYIFGESILEFSFYNPVVGGFGICNRYYNIFCEKIEFHNNLCCWMMYVGLTYVLVQAEIEERRKFLEDMEALGQGGKYRSIIATEISQVCVKSDQLHSAD